MAIVTKLRQEVNLLPLVIVLSYYLLGVSRFLGEYFLGGGHNVEAEGFIFNQLILGSSFFLAIWILSKRLNRFIDVLYFNKILLFFLFYTFLSCFWSQFPFISFKRWIQLLGIVFVGMAAASGAEKFGIRSTLKVLICTTGISSFISILGVFLYPAKFVWTNGQWIGLFSHKNSLGAASALGFTVWLSALFSNFGKPINRFVAFVLVISITLMLGSASATAVVTCLAVFLVFFTLRLPVPTGVKLLLAPIPLLMIYFFFLNFHSLSPIEYILTSLGRDPTLTGRTDLWEAMIVGIAEHPILGVGYNGFWVGGMGLSEFVISDFHWSINQAHNGYLDILNELGVIGFLLFMLILIQALIRGLKLYRNDKNAGVTVLLLLFALVITNIVETSFCRLTSIGWIIFLIIFTGTTPLKRNGKNKNENSSRLLFDKNNHDSNKEERTTPSRLKI